MDMNQPALKSEARPLRESIAAEPRAPEILGHIVSVTGPRAVAVLSRAVRSAGIPERGRVEIGSFVKVETPHCAVMGLVTAVSAPMPMSEDRQNEMKLIELNLVGEISRDLNGLLPSFRRGVASPPTIGDPLVPADRDDLSCVFAPPALATIKVGSLYQDSTVAARLRVDDLLSKHFVIAGSTGSGKSCALACILQRILEDHAYAHIVVLDVHNEYLTAFGDKVEAISLNNFALPFWLLNFQELTAALTTSDEDRDAEAEILSEGVRFARRRYTDGVVARGSMLRRASDAAVTTIESPTPYRLSDVIGYIDEQLGKLERVQLTLPYRKLKARIETMISDPRYGFMFGSLTVQDTMAETLGRLFRVPAENKPIAVVDLSVVPAEILDVVVAVIARLAFDLGTWSRGGLPILLVCEEAHRYAPSADRSQFAPTRQALGRIAKEGRKYGISLALVTQRPSELDPTILSQCSTAIALRLSSERDQQVMRSSSYEGILDLLEFLPLLGDREAIVLGQGVSMPMRIMFDDLDRHEIPRGLNTGFSNSWKVPNIDRHDLETIVSRWRQSGREKSQPFQPPEAGAYPIPQPVAAK
jgi:DNA helicase HerA-like ATPase